MGVAGWFAVRLLTPPPPEPWEDEERAAGMHHEQHDAGRYYTPRYFRTGTDGTVVLRYRVGSGLDSSVDDFRRTYGITAEPKRTGPAEVTFTDRHGGMRRTFTVAYERPVEPDSYADVPARIP